MPLHVSSTICSSSGGQKLYYTASSIIIPVGIITPKWHHHTCRCDDSRYCIKQFSPTDDEYIVLETCRDI